MNKSKFSLADVLTLLAALAFGFVCFLGLNFYTIGDVQGNVFTKILGNTSGNYTKSIIIAVVIALSLIITALGAKLLKRTSRNFKTCFICEMLFLVLFTGLLIFFSYNPFPQFIVVSKHKKEIQTKLNANITQAVKMFKSYKNYSENRKDLYNRKLRSVVAAKRTNPIEYINMGFENNGIDDKKQIENKMFTIRAILFPTNYSDNTNANGLKEISEEWLKDAKNTINDWKPIGIVGVVNEIENKSNEWLSKLVEFSSESLKGEQADVFAYELSFEDVKEQFAKPVLPNLLSIVLSALVYLLMLLSYFITKRHSRFPGLKLIFSRGESSLNEL